MFVIVIVQVALQHLGLDRSLSPKRNLQVKATFFLDTVANVQLFNLAFVVECTVHINLRYFGKNILKYLEIIKYCQRITLKKSFIEV